MERTVLLRCVIRSCNRDHLIKPTELIRLELRRAGRWASACAAGCNFLGKQKTARVPTKDNLKHCEH
ncbi:hypothetical protein Q5P01_014606 [Channa striata]|uniref:Uncharacterized protein n=1 Tax=Channa striata TaxID=64152 RepID=A0AA88MG16_CHASR|nr:hypothetical protein Q5P01_014606 [Channa striata]